VWEHERCPEPFELGRTLLIQGAVLRRGRRRRDAATALGRAVDIFERTGAALWAERARSERARAGVQTTGPDGLTATERRVADLAIQGHTNREIADALFVSVKTVEANLSKVYRKLDVRGRAQLARQARGGPSARPGELER
jgi:DNA-binding CsgD family transcriptional regulator